MKEADGYTAKILNSKAKKKVIIAGPGAGKTHLFRKICDDISNDNNLVLSFINELVGDLKHDLDDVAEVRTLHSFAMGKLRKACKGFYPLLTEIIQEDFELCTETKVKAKFYKEIFSKCLPDKEKELDFYSSRRKYYEYFGPDCSIHTLVTIYKENNRRIPAYTQVMIDEFQDFNKLEAELIDLLGIKNDILLAGDDDQALYFFKNAHAEELKERAKSNKYSKFDLPFCFRCTEVIVKAYNQLIKYAVENEIFPDRLDKEYHYLPREDKDKTSKKYSKILHVSPVHENAAAFYIDQEIQQVYQSDKEATFLVIVPNALKSHIANIEKRLRGKGFKNITSPLASKNGISAIEAYRILLDDPESNLGWRIFGKILMSDSSFRRAIKNSCASATPFKELIDGRNKNKILGLLAILRKIQNEENLTPLEHKRIFKELKYDANKITTDVLWHDIAKSFTTESYQGAPIKITTAIGSKGLTRDYVFLVDFDDKFVFRKDVSVDNSLREFLVTMTRPRKKLIIYSTERKEPKFLSWLSRDLLEKKNVGP